MSQVPAQWYTLRTRHGVSFPAILEDYLPRLLSIQTWAATYAESLPPISIADLEPRMEECNPPLTRQPRGRPRKIKQKRAIYRASRALYREDMGSTGAAAMGLRKAAAIVARQDTIQLRVKDRTIRYLQQRIR